MSIPGAVPFWAFENHTPVSCVGEVFATLPSNSSLPSFRPPFLRGIFDGRLFIQFSLIGRLLSCCLRIGCVILGGLTFCWGHLLQRRSFPGVPSVGWLRRLD